MLLSEITFHDGQHASTNDGEQPQDWCLRLQNSIDWYQPHLEQIAKDDPTPMGIYDAVGAALCQRGHWEGSSVLGEPTYQLQRPLEIPGKSR